MSLDLVVNFFPGDIKDYRHKIIVKTDGYSFEIPIICKFFRELRRKLSNGKSLSDQLQASVGFSR